MAVLILMVGFAVLTLRSLVVMAGEIAQQTVGVVVAGQQRFTRTMVETTLAQLASDPEIRQINASSCERMQAAKEKSGGFFAVLAIGDSQGKPVCAVGYPENYELPTMADREYYATVKEAQGLVFGEYAVSRLTGKQVIHFAYPIREMGQFRGFILASVDLQWFINEESDRYLGDRDVEIFGVDRSGKTLFVYPSQPERLGELVVSPELVSAIFSGQNTARLLKGYDGEYRVYGFRQLNTLDSEATLVFVGVSLSAFKPIIWLVIIGIIILLGALWQSLVGSWFNGTTSAKNTRNRQ